MLSLFQSTHCELGGNDPGLPTYGQAAQIGVGDWLSREIPVHHRRWNKEAFCFQTYRTVPDLKGSLGSTLFIHYSQIFIKHRFCARYCAWHTNLTWSLPSGGVICTLNACSLLEQKGDLWSWLKTALGGETGLSRCQNEPCICCEQCSFWLVCAELLGEWPQDVKAAFNMGTKAGMGREPRELGKWAQGGGKSGR
jgi:hypothetical protein